MSADQEPNNNAAAAAAPAEPAAPEKTSVPEPAATKEKPEAPAEPEAAAPTPETPVSKLAARLPELVKATGHGEMWGVELSTSEPEEHIPTKVVLQKFLRANNGDLPAAVKQLTAALEWRKKLQPLKLIDQVYDEDKYTGLGYVTTHKDAEGKETIITWNIYGAVKDKKKTFGDVQDFIKWRAALMEMGVQKLNLSSVTEAIPDDGDDPYQMIQVHDYLSVSFLRMDPHVKAASRETIQTFGTAYPELLSHKYFVNVPAVMGWMYAAMKLFLAPATLRKFHPMSSGATLAAEIPAIADTLPKEYGGKAGGVKETGATVKLAPATPKKEEKKEEEAQPAEETKTAEKAEPEATKTAEEPEPAAEPKPEEPKAAEEAKPAEDAKPDEPKSEETKAAAESRTAEEAKPAEEAKEEAKEETKEETKPAEADKKTEA